MSARRVADMRDELFPLGRTMATPGALDALDLFDAGLYLKRHYTGDWGDLSAEDKRANDTAVKSGEGRVFSAYVLPDGVTKIWIITEADRSATTVLLPSDY